MIELLTERLRLHPLDLDDLDDLWRLDSDESVMRYVGSGPVADQAAHRERMQELVVRFADSPFGLWGIRKLENDTFYGIALLIPFEDSPDIEIGYRLLPEAWGQGVATEAGRALIRYGFEALRLGRIVGVTHPDNAASRRVLTKLGLAYRGTRAQYGQDVAYYVADRGVADATGEAKPAGSEVDKTVELSVAPTVGRHG
ncbi:GNAT family N-acetyltransferase [Marinivivus vitaminiproducens]|uniref:GNAT family N-acetyltransferase n=1 Tax=Marinivivus vitaminiproducens TaxID=3035935 RepID=UPI0027A9928E|nr:GNAT family N-acetyltransferase [Geminicoccaceae bacterium SCSIO 64248]